MKLYLFTIFSLFTIAVSAQDLGKVTIAELQATKSIIDTSAVAEVIFSKGNTTFFVNGDNSYSALTEISTKIKIYKKEGFEYANIVVPYYSEGSSTEKVSVSDAVTYNLVDGKIEKSKLKSSEEFVIKESENWKTKKFVLPNVKEGSVIEYKTKLVTPFISNLNSWNFQLEIPVLYSYYKFRAPSELIYQHFIKGYEDVKIKNNIEYYEYSLENVKPIKDESYVNNINNYRSSLRLELSAFQPKNGIIKSYSTTWESLIKTIYDGNFGTELNRTRYFGDDLQNILKGRETRDDKIDAIFTYVQNKFKWNGKNGYNTDLGVREAYKTKTGNVADINLVLIAMLREAGIDTNPVLLSTRNHGIAVFPSHAAYNYVIAAVEIPDGLILLDATSKYTRPNILPIRALNLAGRIIRKNGSSALVDLLPNITSNYSAMYNINLNTDGSIEGAVRTKRNNYNAYLYREQNSDLSLDAISKKVQENYQNFEVDEYTNKNMSDLSLDIEDSYKFKAYNVADVIGDQIFFEPSLVFNTKTNPFKDEDRKYPVDFVFTEKENINYVITIPQGYKVEYLPKSTLIKIDSNKYIIKWVINANNDKISLRINEDINSPVIPADEYKELKLLFDEYVKVQNEKIILKKV